MSGQTTSGSIVDLSNYAKKNQIPTKVSQLENDKNYIISVPNTYVERTELPKLRTDIVNTSKKYTDSQINVIKESVQTDIKEDLVKVQGDVDDIKIDLGIINDNIKDVNEQIVDNTDRIIKLENSTYDLPIATKETLGGVVIGDGLDIRGDGKLSVSFPFTDTIVETISLYKVTIGNISLSSFGAVIPLPKISEDQLSYDPNGWSDKSIQNNLSAAYPNLWQISIVKFKSGKYAIWGDPINVMTLGYGLGKSSGVFRFRGEYDPSNTYYNTNEYIDFVQYGTSTITGGGDEEFNSYYVRYGKSTMVTGKEPTNAEYWQPFTEFFAIGAQFITADQIKARLIDTNKLTAVNIDATDIISEKLQTKNNGSGYTKIENGIVEIYNANGNRNIQFGLDPNTNMMILYYYDNNGNLLYSIGPNGLENKDIEKAVLNEYVLERTGTFFNYKSATPGVDPYNDYCYGPEFLDNDYVYVQDKTTGEWKKTDQVKDDVIPDQVFDSSLYKQLKPNETTIGEGYIPISINKATQSVWYYQAAKVNQQCVADTEHGLTTAELAKGADQKWFGEVPVYADDEYKFIRNGSYIMKNEPLHYGKKRSGIQTLALYVYEISNGVRDRIEVFIE